MMNVLTSMLRSRKFWVAFSSGVLSTAAQIAPFLALYLGWDAHQIEKFNGAANSVSTLIGGLGGVLVMMIGLEDAAQKIGLNPREPLD